MPAPAQAAKIVPFWNRLPAVMLYPAHAGAMITIVLLGAAQVLRMLPFGGILSILATVAMYRYAFECLRSTADGYMTPPEVSLGTDRSLGRKFVWLILILMFVAIAGALMFGPTFGIALAIALAACLPGATMTLAMEESLSEALDPTKWLRIIAAIGWPYLALVGVCAAIFMSEGFAQQLVVKAMPLPVALILLGIISNYAVTALFHLMGYALYQYHEALGLAPEAPQLDQRRSAPADPDQDKLDEAAALVRDGKLQEATDLLRAQIRRGGTPGVHAQFRKLLRASGDTAGLLAHGREYVAILIDQANERAAVDLLRECQALDPSFSPETALHVTELAHMAAHLGQAQAAVQLLSGFQERFPRSQYIVTCGLLAADLLHEKLGRDAEARDALLRLKATAAATDPLMPDVEAKLAVIERMIAATTKKSSAAAPQGSPQA